MGEGGTAKITAAQEDHIGHCLATTFAYLHPATHSHGCASVKQH